MFSDASIRIDGLGKCYRIYEAPSHRLLQMLSFGRHQSFREFWALRDVSFSIGRGETVGIIGRNGSGKSTLLQMICGTVSPTVGTVSISGRVAPLLELGAGFNPEFSGVENAFLNAAILGVSREEMAERIPEVLAFSELGDYLQQPVKTYSSGMYARLAFSIAIHVNPEILIVDEALAVGDARFVAKCMRRIKDIQSQGATILFVSHDVSSVRTLCERAIWLDNGAVVEDGDVFPVTGKYMEYMFRDELAGDFLISPQEESPVAVDSMPDRNVGSADVPDSHSVGAAVDARPVTHWGSRKGMILGASVCDEHGSRVDVITWGKQIEVIINVCIPQEIRRAGLSVAFSIKDLKGTDLIVATTHDCSPLSLPECERFKVRFRMSNALVTGKYLLVAAVENRVDRDIHYYEYLEGAHYFSSLTEYRFFGLFRPTIERCVEVM